jgi:hypothetical protein
MKKVPRIECFYLTKTIDFCARLIRQSALIDSKIRLLNNNNWTLFSANKNICIVENNYSKPIK